jgi:hypothetical protein
MGEHFFTFCFEFIPIRFGMPWMPIRIRQNDADPTRSGSTTLAIRYCLSEHVSKKCKSSAYLLASSSSRVNMDSSRADGSSLNKHKLKGQIRKIGNSFTNLKLFLGLAFSPEIFWLESLQDIQERMKGFLAHNRMTVLGLSEK